MAATKRKKTTRGAAARKKAKTAKKPASKTRYAKSKGRPAKGPQGRKPKPEFTSAADAKDKGFCGAALSNNRGWCGNPKGHGTNHPGSGYCRKHGGNSPSLVKAAQREEAIEAVNDLGLLREIDPFDALEEELHRTAGVIAWLGDQIRSLQHESASDSEMYGPVGTEGESVEGPEHHAESKRHILIQIWEEERAHFAKVAKMMIDVGFEQRRVELAEREGQLMAKVVQRVLDRLELSPKQLKKAPGVVREAFTYIEGEAVEIT